MWTLSLFIFSQVYAANFCQNIFADRSSAQETFSNKVTYAKNIQSLRLDAYVSRWVVRDAKYQGPFPMTGETLVVGVKASKARKWMRTIGKKSIGFGVHGLPENNPGSAYIRVADKFYYYNYIQAGKKPIDALKALFESYQEGYTEATFMVRPEEIKALEQFFSDRAKGIVAKKDIRNGPLKGEVISPAFNHSKATLTQESCAAACSSPFNEKWLEHYDHAEILLQLKNRLGLIDSHVAKHFIWKHARNANLASLTLFALSESKLELEKGLQERLEWGLLRGMPPYALVPDLINSDKSKTLWTQRLALADWLKTIGK